jgi:hypothetical protein
MFVRNFLPRYPQPDADAIENLSMAVIIDQKRLGGGSHSTVGTVTDIAPILRVLFSRIGKPYVGYSNSFSFNDPAGMCPECHGIGRKLSIKAENFLDMSKSLNEGKRPVNPIFKTLYGRGIMCGGTVFPAKTGRGTRGRPRVQPAAKARRPRSPRTRPSLLTSPRRRAQWPRVRSPL